MVLIEERAKQVQVQQVGLLMLFTTHNCSKVRLKLGYPTCSESCRLCLVDDGDKSAKQPLRQLGSNGPRKALVLRMLLFLVSFNGDDPILDVRKVFRRTEGERRGLAPDAAVGQYENENGRTCLSDSRRGKKDRCVGTQVKN